LAGGPRIEIDFNKIYESNSSGKFKIIKDLGRDDRSRLYVRIKFLETGTELDVRYDIAVDGKVRDDLYGIDFNKLYDSLYYGKYKIIQYIGRNNDSKKIVRIKFINTGYEYNVLLRQALNSQVKDYSVDYYSRHVDCQSNNYDEVIVKILKNRWKGMMSRCYDKNNIKYCFYGGIGVSVCEYWHSFDNFLYSVRFLRNYDKFYNNPQRYTLDKDYLQQNINASNRIYSPDTCIA
jgi:hypothetical protein